MKKVFWIFTSVLALLISACGTSATPTALPTVVLEAESQPAVSSANASSSAIVVPVKKVELSFPTSGAVKTVEVEAGDVVQAGDVLITIDTAVLEAKVKEAEAAVITEQTKLAYIIRTQVDNERLQSAQASIDRAQAAVDILKAQITQAVLTAPFGGTIVSVEISPAEVVTPGQIVIVLGDLSLFQIETTDMSEKNMTTIQVGQPASIFIEALDQNFSGNVIDIARISETIGGDVVFKVTIKLADQPEGLRWGMSAEVKIEAE